MTSKKKDRRVLDAKRRVSRAERDYDRARRAMFQAIDAFEHAVAARQVEYERLERAENDAAYDAAGAL